MTITEIAQKPQTEKQEAGHPITRMGLLPLAGLLFFVAVIWRVFDIFVLGLGDTWINIMPSKLFPLLIIAGIFWKYRNAEFSSVLGLAKGPYFKTQIVLGIGIFAAWHLMLNVFPKIIYGYLDPSYNVGFVILNVDILWYLFLFFLTNGFLEEVLFRGLLQNSFRQRTSTFGAIMLSGFLFGIWHVTWPLVNGLNSEFSVGQAISLVVFSWVFAIFYSYYYENFSSRRTLVGPITAHTFMNFINENFKVGSDPLVQGPDYFYGSPTLLGLTIGMFLITFFALTFMAYRYRIEDVQRHWNSVRRLWTKLRIHQ
ncbi:MAG: lysostaphin resistance A-like protein [Candidatus Hodarchaeota archaeon]